MKAKLLVYLTITAICLSAPIVSVSQRIPPVDSLSKVITEMLKHPPFFDDIKRPTTTKIFSDSLFVCQHYELAKKLENDKPDSAILFINKAFHPALKLKWLKAVSLLCQFNGDYLTGKENYSEAIKWFLLCITLEEKRKDEIRMADLYDELGTVYYYQEIFPKSLEYTNKALSIYQRFTDTTKLAMAYSHLGTLHLSREYCEQRTTAQKQSDFLLAIEYFNQSIEYCRMMGNESRVMHNYINIGATYNKLEQPEKALPFLRTAADYYRSHGELRNLTSTLFPLGIAYRRLKKYPLSLQAYQESISLSLTHGFTGGIQYLYEAMAQTYEEMNDFKNAYTYYIKYMHARDSVFSAEKSREIFELETRYQTEKKEKEILKLSAENRERKLLLYSLSALLVMVLALAFFIVRNFRNKKRIQEQNLEIKEQRILELEKEKQLIAAKSVLQGEEAERSRLANDLHDGLGGLLSGVKLNLSSMKENAVLTTDNIRAFDHALGLLDTSIKELRRIAHNMMPETLIHYGLKTALQDFVQQVGSGSEFLSFSFFGENFRYSKELELTAYRITQELVNNALKHSGATHIDLQLFLEPDRLCVQLSDNGKGFDPSLPDSAATEKGLSTIRDRVKVMDGKFDLSSRPGEGTEVIVEFSLT